MLLGTPLYTTPTMADAAEKKRVYGTNTCAQWDDFDDGDGKEEIVLAPSSILAASHLGCKWTLILVE